MQKSARQVFAIVIFCFFISGMAGLIYQLAWMRYLALFLGHTSYAVVAVLVAFMGGLAIGNAAFGVWAADIHQDQSGVDHPGRGAGWAVAVPLANPILG